MPVRIKSLVCSALNHYVSIGSLRRQEYKPLIVSHEFRLYLILEEYFTFSNRQTLAILLPYGIVVELYPVRILAADYPISIIFKPSRLSIFHLCVVVYRTLRAFQQLNKIFNIHHCIKSHLSMMSFFFNLTK